MLSIKFRVTRTVNDIVNHLTDTVEQLEDHAERQEKDAAAFLAAHEHAVGEHARATSVAKKLKELLS